MFSFVDLSVLRGSSLCRAIAYPSPQPFWDNSPFGRTHMDRDRTTIAGPDVSHDLSTKLQQSTQPQAPLRGSVLVLIQFDVCEEIRLDELRKIFPARKVEGSFKKAPAYVRYQRTPVEETLEPLTLESGERLAGEIKYYDYGVVSLEFELPFSGSWETLVELSCRWTSDTNFEKLASRIVKQKLERAAPALVKPYDPKVAEWLQEDYFIFHVREIEGSPTADQLLAAQSVQIAQVVRGEMQILSEGERQEILQSRISYYPSDLAVIGWNAAFLYDTPAGAETAIQLLQYANSQLLEFRHYDELMTKELENVYDFLEAGGHGLVVPLAHRPRREQAAHRPARRERTHRTRRQRHQVPQRHVLRAPLQTLRPESRSPRLQRPGQRKAPDRRRPLQIHGRTIQPVPRLRAGADGGRHPDHRTHLLLQRQTNLAFPSLSNSTTPGAPS